MKKLSLALLTIISLLGTNALAAADAEGCKKLGAAVAKSKKLQPEELGTFIGKVRSDFPCAEAVSSGAGPAYSVREYALGDRRAVLLTKEYSEQDRSVVTDAILLPAFAKGERFMNNVFCRHTLPKAPAIAIVKPRKDAYQVKAAWVIDREEEKILKVSNAAVKCENDPGATP